MIGKLKNKYETVKQKLESEYKLCIIRRAQRFKELLEIDAPENIVALEIKLVSQLFHEWLWYKIVDKIMYRIRLRKYSSDHIFDSVE